MKRKTLIGLMVLLALLMLTSLIRAETPDGPTGAAPPSTVQLATSCEDGTQASGAIYRICMPTLPPWNGDLIVFAHGYMNPYEPVHIPEDQLRLPDGTYIPDVVQLLGYAFATTSYRTNGLAVPEGLADLVDLVNVFKTKHSTVRRVYLVGASEGGLITTLAVEQHPAVFSGGLAVCGPIGDFRAQVGYLGDYRVMFDYFFPGLMPGSPISIPQSLVDNWDTYYRTAVLPVVSSPTNAISVTQLFSVTAAAYDPRNPTSSMLSTINHVLWYNVFAMNDARTKLGGQPFDNMSRVYTGSFDDARLNTLVQRFSGDQAALEEIQAHYQTAGRPAVPLVTLHTQFDEVVPYWHETLYRAKVAAQGMTPRHDNLPPINRYGHCNFTMSELQQALALLQARVTNPPPFNTFVPVVRK
jgi:pimeloyl-ACP methyl ester carboxylesterase